jgi:catechol 2,3-dioxygenase-like lactoylglutathione lyase family enzyme
MTTLNTPPASSPLASFKINHAAIRVPDFDAAVAWYADKLDFRSKQTVSVAGLSFGFLYPAGDDSFHFELMAPPARRNAALIKICMTATTCLGGITPVSASIAWTRSSTN